MEERVTCERLSSAGPSCSAALSHHLRLSSPSSSASTNGEREEEERIYVANYWKKHSSL